MIIRQQRLKVKYLVLLATTAALNDVKNEILNVSDVVKKAEYTGKISDIEKNIFYYF